MRRNLRPESGLLEPAEPRYEVRGDHRPASLHCATPWEHYLVHSRLIGETRRNRGQLKTIQQAAKKA